MARIRIHVLCGQSAGECGCPPDDELDPEATPDDGDEAA